MEIRAIGAVLPGFAVGPDQKVSVGRDGAANGNAELRLIRQARAEIKAGKVGSPVASIVEFKPILEVVVGWIGQRGHIVRHPLVDHHSERSRGGIVRAAWCGVIKHSTSADRAIRI